MDDETVTLRETLAVLNRRRLIIIFTVVVVTILAVAIVSRTTPTYEARAQVLLDPVRRTHDLALSQDNLSAALRTEPVIMTSRPVLELAATRVDASVDALQSRTRTEVAGDSRVVHIIVRGSDPELAAASANAVADAYVEYRHQLALDQVFDAKDALERRADDLRVQVDELAAAIVAIEDAVGERLRAEYASVLQATPLEARGPIQSELNQRIVETSRLETATLVAERDGQLASLRQLATQLSEYQDPSRVISGGSTVIRQAEPPGTPIAPNPQRAGLFAALAGIIIGVGLAFVRDHLDDRIRDDEDVKRATGGRPVLGRIPHWATHEMWPTRSTKILGGSDRLVSLSEPDSVSAEAYRTASTNIRFLLAASQKGEGPGRVILLTSAGPGDGKTSTAANLAVTAARAGQRVVLIDSDLRGRRVSHGFGLDESRGLTEALLDDHELDLHLHDVGVAGLSVLPAGSPPPNPTELLGSPHMAALMAQIRQRFDMVILDSPPVLGTADALELARLSDTTVLVVRAQHTHRRRVRAALERLVTLAVPVGGAIVNDLRGRETTYGHTIPFTSLPAARTLELEPSGAWRLKRDGS